MEQYGFIRCEIQSLENIYHAWIHQEYRICIVDEDVALGETLEQLAKKGQNQDIDSIVQSIKASTDCKYILLHFGKQEEEHLIFLSDSKEVRPLEFLDFIIGDFGLIKGNSQCGIGLISKAIFKVKQSSEEVEGEEFYIAMAYRYFAECHWIFATDYARERETEIYDLPRYVKKRIPWAFVKTLDIVGEGEALSIKSLENESGLTICAGENVYIMIGCRGECYDIQAARFEATYEATDEPLDIIEQMMEFIPAIEQVSTGEYMDLEQVAKLCYPRQGGGIFARPLSRRTKVFSKNSNQEYFVGRPGDYLAIRQDDIEDIYIIQEDIFHQTYEKL